jgi:hypothetical protein
MMADERPSKVRDASASHGASPAAPSLRVATWRCAACGIERPRFQ